MCLDFTSFLCNLISGVICLYALIDSICEFLFIIVIKVPNFESGNLSFVVILVMVLIDFFSLQEGGYCNFIRFDMRDC